MVCGVGLCRRILGMVGGSNFARRRRALVVDSFYQISFQFIDILKEKEKEVYDDELMALGFNILNCVLHLMVV